MAAVVPYLLAASVGVSAIGSISQGNSQGAAGDYNAAIGRRNAKLAMAQGQIEADQQRRKSVIAIGDARAKIGASGVTSEGSPIDVLASSAANAEMDNQLIKYRARMQALGYKNQANLDEASADNARFGGYFGAASSILTGAATAYGMGLFDSAGSSGLPYTGGEMNGTGSSY